MRPDAEKQRHPGVLISEFDPKEIAKLHDLYMFNGASSYVFISTTKPEIGLKDSERVFVAKRGMIMVGAIFYRPQQDHAYLLHLIVKQDYRGQGIGRELILFSEEKAQNDGLPQVTIKAISDQLVEYYKHLGFVLQNGSGRTLTKTIFQNSHQPQP